MTIADSDKNKVFIIMKIRDEFEILDRSYVPHAVLSAALIIYIVYMFCAFVYRN